MRNFDTEQIPRSCKHTLIGLCKKCYQKYYPEKVMNPIPCKNGVTEVDMSGKVEKPWGYYIDHYRSEKTVLKTIVVNPHSRLSLQSHENRIETWTVLEGCGIAETENTVYQTMYISRVKIGSIIKIEKGKKHRLINDTNKPLVVAEVQYGICDEDDIERFEDDYGR